MPAAATKALSATPQWAAAAQALVEGCVDLQTDEDRVSLLVAVCDELGDHLYPAFLRVLTLIGRHGDHGARAAVAVALVHALRTGRLPSGRRGAWGSNSSAGSAIGYGSTRSLGPIEYLCTWHAQGAGDRALSPSEFDSAARAIIELVNCSDEARRLYCDKLLAEVDDPIAGALNRRTRHAMRQLAIAWASGASSVDACARFLAALDDARAQSLASQMPQPAFTPR